MSAGEIAGLIAAVAFVLLVGVLAVPLIKLGGVFDETRSMIKGVSDETVPLLSEVTTTVTTTNAQLVRVDAITSNVAGVTTNVSALTALFAATLGGPVIKVAAFTYGVRRALAGRNRSRVERRCADQTQGRQAAARAAGGGRPRHEAPVLDRPRGDRRECSSSARCRRRPTPTHRRAWPSGVQGLGGRICALRRGGTRGDG